MGSARSVSTVTIQAGQSISEAKDLSGASIACVIIPGNWTPASLTFRVGLPTSGGLADLQTPTGTEMVYTVSPGCAYLFNPWDWAGATLIQFRSGTSASPVAQANTVVLQLITWAQV